MAVSTRVYSALYMAAAKIGANNYQSQRAAHAKAGLKASTFRFTVTDAHRELVDAMGSKTIEDEEAMALLHQYDTMKQRFPD